MFDLAGLPKWILNFSLDIPKAPGDKVIQLTEVSEAVLPVILSSAESFSVAEQRQNTALCAATR